MSKHSAQINAHLKSIFAACVLTLLLGAPSRAQQPFFTDDADVSEKGKFHLEFINEFDLLQKAAYPNLKQNVAGFTLNYGLFEKVELGINVPWITIFNAKGTSPRVASGVGDSNLSVKYKILEERNGSRFPAMTVAFNIEIPTGDKDRQLGSGLVDYDLNGVFQKTLTERTTLRVNTGILFSGNTLTGAVGIQARGTVFTGGTSIVRQFTEKLDLGAEINGAVARNARLNKGQLQVQVGGNYALTDKCTLDFGLIAGHYSASPRLGAQIGFSMDF